MLGIQIRKWAQPHCLMIVLLAAAAAASFSSCASETPKTALISDPDARDGSAIPWNRPANWEGKGNIPGGISAGQDPFGQSGNGGTGGY